MKICNLIHITQTTFTIPLRSVEVKGHLPTLRVLYFEPLKATEPEFAILLVVYKLYIQYIWFRILIL